MASYPTAADYRGRAGTVRGPSRPGRAPPGRRLPPGRGNFRARPAAVPRLSPARVPSLPRPPSAYAGAVRAFSGLGGLGVAFGVGFVAGTWLFQAGRQNGWVYPTTLSVYSECPWGPGPVMVGKDHSHYCGTIPAPAINPAYELQFGVDTWEWIDAWPPGTIFPSDWTYGARAFATRFPAQGDTLGDPYPRYAPGVGLALDPGFVDAVGRPMWHNPASAPIALPGSAPAVGPVAPKVWKLPLPRPSPGVGNEGYQAGEPQGHPAPSPRPQTQPNPARPGRGVKEVKIRSGVLRFVSSAYGFATEVEDVVDAFHKAIDKKCGKPAQKKWLQDNSKPNYSWKREHWATTYSRKQGRYIDLYRWVRRKGGYRAPSLTEKGIAIYKYANCIDIAEAFENLVDNNAEDAILGTASKDVGKASAKGRPGRFGFVGFETGPAL